MRRIASRLCAILRREAHHHREVTVAAVLVEFAGRSGRRSPPHGRVDIAGRKPVARGARAVDVDLTVGWPSDASTARSVMPGTVAITFLILSAVFSSVSRSLPNSLTEFSPFTPEAASSTLSSMYCEKLNSTPGNAAASCRSSARSASPCRRRAARCRTVQRHEELGVEEAGRVGAVVGTAVLRDDGLHFRVAVMICRI